jgi:CDP-glycerol glycerophosphotransferase
MIKCITFNHPFALWEVKILKKFLKLVKRILLNHQIETASLNNGFLNLTFRGFIPIYMKRYLVLKNRENGRRLKIQIINNQCSVKIDDFFEVSDGGKFDLFVTSHVLNKNLYKRCRFSRSITLDDFSNDKERIKVQLVKTVNNNLSVFCQKKLFDHKVKEIKQVGQSIYLCGEIFILDNIIPEVIEIILRRRDNKQSYGFKAETKRSDQSDHVLFNCILYLEKLKEDLVTNSRWDSFIQIRDNDQRVVTRELISLKGYKDFTAEEDRYLVNVQVNSDHILSLYATEGRNSMAFWYTDNEQFETTYNIAKGKTIFNLTCKHEEMNEKMVFFESFFGKSYAGNPKYIYEEMIRNEKYKDFQFVWSYSGENPSIIPGNPIIVNRTDKDYYVYLALSKYWVSNILFPIHKKREGNVYLQTWHGTPLKKLGFDIEVEGPETLARENFYIESRNWDYLIADNEYSSDIFKRAFKFEKEMLVEGYPANDIFYKSDLKERISNLKRKLNIPENKKVILYAPTWRDNEMTGSWKHSFSLKFDIERFYRELNDEYVLLLKMHHLISDTLIIDEKFHSFVYDLSKYDDIQELYIISDILITDYSSVFFDYANSLKPILFYAYDFELYKDNIRGFYLNMEEDLPGPVIRTEDDLLKAIININDIHANYKNKYKRFYDRFCYKDDGKAAKRIIERVFK